MLVSDPKKRASLDDLRHHDWLREKIPSWLEEEEAVEPVSAPAETDNTVEERTNNSETPGGAVGVEVDSTGTAIAATAAGGADTVEGGVYSSAEEYAANMKKPKTFYPSDKGMGFAGKYKSNLKFLNFSILVVTYFMWSAVLDSSGVLLSYLITSLA